MIFTDNATFRQQGWLQRNAAHLPNSPGGHVPLGAAIAFRTNAELSTRVLVARISLLHEKNDSKALIIRLRERALPRCDYMGSKLDNLAYIFGIFTTSTTIDMRIIRSGAPCYSCYDPLRMHYEYRTDSGDMVAERLISRS